MIYFGFTPQGSGAPLMAVLDAVEPDAALDEALNRLRDVPGAAETHVFDGDRFVGTVEAPAFGFAGVNATTGLGSPVEVGSAAGPHAGDVRV